jgi:hypothetical protein
MTRKRRVTMIQTVIRLRNNVVMVFDEYGEQVPVYQGQYDDVKEKILRDAPSGTKFNHWFGHALYSEAVPERSW